MSTFESYILTFSHKLTKEFILNVLEKSTKKGYTELTAMLLEKCKNILHTDLEQTSDEYTLNIDEYE